MSFKRVQGKAGNGSGAALTVTWVAATTTNNLVVVGILFSTVTKTADTVTDTASSTYAKTTNSPADNVVRIYQWFAVQAGAATSVTVNCTGVGNIRLTADEFSGNVTSSVFDKDSTGTGTGTSFAVTSFTPTVDRELIVATVGMPTNQTFTAGTNYTLGATNGNQLANEARLDSLGADTAPISGTASTTWAEVAGAYKFASVDAPSKMMMGIGI